LNGSGLTADSHLSPSAVAPLSDTPPANPEARHEDRRVPIERFKGNLDWGLSVETAKAVSPPGRKGAWE
jgi:hypothetical protein